MTGKTRRVVLSALGLLVITLFSVWVMLYRDGGWEVVSITTLTQERKAFEDAHPLSETLEDGDERWEEYQRRCNLYAAASEWDGKRVLVRGCWDGQMDGWSLLKQAIVQRSEFLFLVRGEDSDETKPAIVQSAASLWVPAPVKLEQGDLIRVYGIYHAKGYHWDEARSWLEFLKIERWNVTEKRWERADPY